MTDVIVTRNEPEKRYEARIDGELAGYTEFMPGTGFVVMPHTEIFTAFEGKGVGSELARGALDDIRAEGLTVLATCPFIHGWIVRHEDYHDMLYTGRRATDQETVEQD